MIQVNRYFSKSDFYVEETIHQRHQLSPEQGFYIVHEVSK